MAILLMTDGFHPAPQSSYLILCKFKTVVIVKVVSVSADVGWVVIPYKATQILLLIAIKSASLTI